MRGSRTWGVVAVLVMAAVIGGACKKRGPQPGDETAAGTDLGEEKLAGGSSLARARQGLGPEEGGVLGDVRFAYDSSDLDSAAHEVLARNVEWLKANPRPKVELEGHCDNRGTIEYNLALGAKRAKVVKDHLVAQGISPDRLSTISYGEELPLCHEETETCWARNRRVHSVILGQ